LAFVFGGMTLPVLCGGESHYFISRRKTMKTNKSLALLIPRRAAGLRLLRLKYRNAYKDLVLNQMV
jgi:hypothetical protein